VRRDSAQRCRMKSEAPSYTQPPARTRNLASLPASLAASRVASVHHVVEISHRPRIHRRTTFLIRNQERHRTKNVPLPSRSRDNEGPSVRGYCPLRVAWFYGSRKKPDQPGRAFSTSRLVTCSALVLAAREPEPVQGGSGPQWCLVPCWLSGLYRGARKTAQR
jgi:hypothetical protein